MKSLNKRIKKVGLRLGPEYDNFKTEGITQKLKPKRENVLKSSTQESVTEKEVTDHVLLCRWSGKQKIEA